MKYLRVRLSGPGRRVVKCMFVCYFSRRRRRRRSRSFVRCLLLSLRATIVGGGGAQSDGRNENELHCALRTQTTQRERAGNSRAQCSAAAAVRRWARGSSQTRASRSSSATPGAACGMQQNFSKQQNKSHTHRLCPAAGPLALGCPRPSRGAQLRQVAA